MANRDVTILQWTKGCEYHNQMGSFLASQIRKCRQIDILTGYFFFDGFQAIQNALNENTEITIRILVGMNAGFDASGLIHEVYEHERNQLSDDYSEEYVQKLKEVLQKWPPEKLTESQSKAWKHYAEMIHNGHLQIRKTREPNHSKLYIFHPKQGNVSYTSGSSNFSYSGLLGRQELNVHVATEYAGEICGLFDELWNDSIPIAEAELKDQSQTSEIEHILIEDTPDSLVSHPFDACMKVLREYKKLNIPQKDVIYDIQEILKQVGFDPLKYQVDAVSTAQNILKANGGVIIADVVGLGKSVMASLLAKLSKGPGVVLAPPALLAGDKGWYGYLRKFKLANEDPASAQEAWSAWSMYMPDKDALEKAETIIIDEVHNLRNPNTQLYQNICNLIQGSRVPKRVICLSATPYNNRLHDLVALFNLFPAYGCGGKKDEFVRKLKDYADKLDELKKNIRVLSGIAKTERIQERNELMRQVAYLIYPFTVRRNRIDLRMKYEKEIGDRIPFLAPPINRKAELTEEQSVFYDDILNNFFAGIAPQFKGAMYHPMTYVTQKQDANVQSQNNLYSMICRFMVSRWESSPVAFEKTLETLTTSLEQSIHVFKKTGIFFRDIDEIEEESNKDIHVGGISEANLPELLKRIQKSNKKSAVYFSPDKSGLTKGELAKSVVRDVYPMGKDQYNCFLSDLEADLKTLKRIKSQFLKCELDQPQHDGKLQALKKVIADVLKNGISYMEYDEIQGMTSIHHPGGTDRQEEDNPRKIIVFSYYADTAKYVFEELTKLYPNEVIYADGSNLDRTRKAEIEEHFMSVKKDNSASSTSKAKSKEKMILVCTDVLSEGINLNQAGIVINYDIAYNPVRVIQRIGRINRIDQKVFDRIYSVNFFPTGPNDTHIDLNNVESIAVGKMMDIHSLLGEDSCILSDEEKPRPAEFIKSISPDEQERMTVSIDTELDMLYENGMKKLGRTSAEQIREYEDYLDCLIPRWAVIPAEEHKLFIFQKSSAAILTTEIPDFTNKGIAAKKNLPCVDILKHLMTFTTPKTKNLLFHPKTGDPIWDAYQTVKNGNGFDQNTDDKSGKQSQEQIEAIKMLRRYFPELTQKEKNTIGARIRKSTFFAKQLLQCDKNLKEIRSLLQDDIDKSSHFIQNDGLEFMIIGTTPKEN